MLLRSNGLEGALGTARRAVTRAVPIIEGTLRLEARPTGHFVDLLGCSAPLSKQKGLTKPNRALLSKAKGKAGYNYEARCLYLESMTS